MVGEALGRIEEKVAAQQAAGIDAAKTRNQDKPPEAARIEEEDKEAARALLGRKKKKRKPAQELAFYERLWFKGTAIVLALAGIAAVLAAVFLVKPSAESLYKSAEQVIASGNHDAQVEARTDGPIHRYLNFYDDRNDEQTTKIRQWADDIDAKEFERLVLKRRRIGIDVYDYDLESRKAVDAEDAGDVRTAREIWTKLDKYKDEPRKPSPSEKRSCGLLAQNRLITLDEMDKHEQRLEKTVTKDGVVKGVQLADEIEKKAAEAYQLELQKSPDAARAWERLKQSLDGAGPETRPWWLLAAKRCRGLKEKSKSP
jgi:hypothetical protein